MVATLSDRRSSVVSSSSVGKEEKSSGRFRNSATISTSTAAVMRQRQAEIEQQRRQRQDQHREQRHHAERQADVAAGRELPEPAVSVGRKPRRRRLQPWVRRGRTTLPLPLRDGGYAGSRVARDRSQVAPPPNPLHKGDGGDPAP